MNAGVGVIMDWMHLHGSGGTHRTGAHSAGRSLGVDLPVGFRRLLLVDRFIMLQTTTPDSQLVSQEAISIVHSDLDSPFRS